MTNREIKLNAIDCRIARCWDHLASEMQTNPSLKPVWLTTSLSTLASEHDSRVLVREDRGQPTAVIPYFTRVEKHCGIPFNVLALASNAMSYHAELLIPNDSTEALVELLDSVGTWDIFHAANIVDVSPSSKLLQELAAENGFDLIRLDGDESPYLEVACDWDTFLARQGKKFRYKYRKRQALLDRADVLLEKLHAPEQVDELIEAMSKIETRSWKARYREDLCTRAWELPYYRALLPVLANRGELAAFLLHIEGQPAAYSLCYSDGEWVGQLKTAFDESFASLSPGGVVIDASIKFAFDIGAREFDFLGHTDRHKSAWTKSTRQHHDYFLFSHRLRARTLATLRRLKGQMVRYQRKAPVKPEHDVSA